MKRKPVAHAPPAARPTRATARRKPPPRAEVPPTTAAAPAEPPALTTKAVWPLMDRLQIPDEIALRLLGHAAGVGPSGKRPRFTLDAEETRRLNYLREIASTLEIMFGEAGPWLRQPADALPFHGQAPLDYMVARGAAGIAEVLRFLGRWSLSAALGR